MDRQKDRQTDKHDQNITLLAEANNRIKIGNSGFRRGSDSFPKTRNPTHSLTKTITEPGGMNALILSEAPGLEWFKFLKTWTRTRVDFVKSR